MKNSVKYYAFFDVDGTLIKGAPMLDFLKYYYLNLHSNQKHVGYLKYYWFISKSYVYRFFGINRQYLNTCYYRCYANESVDRLKYIGVNWFNENIRNKKNYNFNLLNELVYHKNNGGTVVLVTGSFFPCIEPFINQYDIKHVLMTSLEVINSRITGSILLSPVIGDGKVKAIIGFIQNNQALLRNSYAYGDHVSDIPMLCMVGNPKVVRGDREMERQARKHGWEIINTQGISNER